MNARNSKRGKVKFDVDRERLRISLPMSLVNKLKAQGHKVRRYNYIGLEANRKNEMKVAEIVEMMNQDLTNSHLSFDPSLKKYFDLLKPKISSAEKKLVLDGIPALRIKDVWDDWLTVKKLQVEGSTFAVKYKRYTTLLSPFMELPVNQETATDIVGYLQSQNDSENARNCLSQLTQAVGLKVNRGEIDFNYFSCYENPIRKKIKTSTLTDEEDRKAFSREDMELIIKTFYQHPKCVDYAPLVEFLF